MLSRSEQETILAEVSRAPSVHNVQPARWRFDDDAVTLLHDRSRRLPVGDPTGRDIEASLGASFEGMRIALSRRDLALGQPTPLPDDEDEPLRSVCTARVVAGAMPDPLGEQVMRRRTWRGDFVPADALSILALTAAVAARDDALVLAARADVDVVARLNDACSWEFMGDPAYHAELFDWMRLSRSDPRWERDGLNADCLAMSTLERRAASIAFRPAPFGALKALGVARALVAEESRVKTAAAAIVFHRSANESPFDSGRAFYRLWLELTAAGFVACPMSSIADSRSGSAEVRTRWRVPAGRRVVNVLRVGKAQVEPARSPRLPTCELLVVERELEHAR
jgi:nitroreductase